MDCLLITKIDTWLPSLKPGLWLIASFIGSRAKLNTRQFVFFWKDWLFNFFCFFAILIPYSTHIEWMKEIQQCDTFFSITIYCMIQQKSRPLHYQRFLFDYISLQLPICQWNPARFEDADVFSFCPFEKCVNFVPSDFGIPGAVWQMPKDIVRMPVKNLIDWKPRNTLTIKTSPNPTPKIVVCMQKHSKF